MLIALVVHFRPVTAHAPVGLCVYYDLGFDVDSDLTSSLMVSSKTGL
jgi:hypothetical protein